MPRKKKEEVTDVAQTASSDEGETQPEADENVPDEAADTAEVEPESGAFGEPEPEPDPEPLGDVEPEPVVEEAEEIEPPIEIPEPGALVLVTDTFGVVHQALIIRPIESGDEALVVCTKDGSDDQLVLVHGAVGTPGTWAAPA